MVCLMLLLASWKSWVLPKDLATFYHICSYSVWITGALSSKINFFSFENTFQNIIIVLFTWIEILLSSLTAASLKPFIKDSWTAEKWTGIPPIECTVFTVVKIKDKKKKKDFKKYVCIPHQLVATVYNFEDFFDNPKRKRKP